jgi:hypothetical protein
LLVRVSEGDDIGRRTARATCSSSTAKPDLLPTDASSLSAHATGARAADARLGPSLELKKRMRLAK